MKRLFGSFFALGQIATIACASWAGASDVPGAGGLYDQLYPLYAIHCAGTQWDRNFPKGLGNPYGHSFIYLRGACRDTSVNYPRVKVCGPNSGVGLSLDKGFLNTRYIAVDGMDLLLNGDLSDASDLKNASPELENAIDQVAKSGSFDGVRYTVPAADQSVVAQEGLPHYIAGKVLGTNYALRFARNLSCSVIPINERMLQAGVDWANRQNEPYIAGKKIYTWNPADECEHFAHNVLGAMGIGKIVATHDGPFFYVVSIASAILTPWHSLFRAPMNGILESANEAAAGKGARALESVYKNRESRQNFLRFGRLPGTDGVLLWERAGHEQDNEVFMLHSKRKFLDLPIIRPFARKWTRLLDVASNTELKANLEAYRDRLKSAIDSSTDDTASYCESLASERHADDAAFEGFCEKYVDYLKTSLSDVEGRLAKVTTAE